MSDCSLCCLFIVVLLVSIGNAVTCREYFITAMEVAVLAWGALRLICEGLVQSAWAVDDHMRPHHVAADFRACWQLPAELGRSLLPCASVACAQLCLPS